MLSSINFDVVPKELVQLDQWVVWRKHKVPYQAKFPHKKANVNDPKTWSSFIEAINAIQKDHSLGLGFVLAANGIIGIDIDKCIEDNDLNHQALALLSEIGCRYIERSPSGNGYHGYALGRLSGSGKRMMLNGLNVEIYDNARYFTFTGDAIKSEELEIFKNIKDFKHLNNTASLPLVSSDSSVSLVTSVSSVSSVCTDETLHEGNHDIPSDIYVNEHGERNDKIFILARYAKSQSEEFNFDYLKKLFDMWFKQSVCFMQNKDYDYNFTQFISAYTKVKLPYGRDVIEEVILNLRPLPENLKKKCINAKHEHLLLYCSSMQRFHKNSVFFLSCRKAAELIGCDKDTANRLLNISCMLGILILVREGKMHSAARYQMNSAYINL